MSLEQKSKNCFQSSSGVVLVDNLPLNKHTSLNLIHIHTAHKQWLELSILYLSSHQVVWQKNTIFELSYSFCLSLNAILSIVQPTVSFDSDIVSSCLAANNTSSPIYDLLRDLMGTGKLPPEINGNC